MEPVYEVLLNLVVCAVLAVASYWRNVMTASGAVATFAVGFVIGIFGSIVWLVLLMLFALTSFVATKYKFELKKKLGVQEGKRGERTYRNVLANGMAPALCAILSWSGWGPLIPKNLAGLMFVGAVAVGAADTIASEIGVLSRKTYLITTFKPVKPGANGGVSSLGTLWALAAACYTSVVGWILFGFFPDLNIGNDPFVVAIPIAAGFIGCNLDSLMGATLEERGWFTKGWTNFVSVLCGALIALGLMLWLRI